MHPVKFGEAFRPKIHQLRAKAAKINSLHGDPQFAVLVDKLKPDAAAIKSQP